MKIRIRVIMMIAVLLIGIALWLPGLRPRRVSAQSPGLMGSYGFLATVPYTGGNSPSGVFQGVVTFDGAGNVTGTSTQVQPDPNQNATTVQVQTDPLAGTYTVNGNGTATLTLSGSGGDTTTISLVITDGGSSFTFVQTGWGNYLLYGTARKQ